MIEDRDDINGINGINARICSNGSNDSNRRNRKNAGSGGTDRFSVLPPHSIRLGASCLFDRKIRLVEQGLLASLDYGALADFFREKRNQFAAGEFWGKIMRASAEIYAYTGNATLLEKMKGAVRDIISIQGPDGEISTAPKEQQPNGSGGADLWERKYVMLGLLGYYGVTDDDDEKRTVAGALSKLLDYTISQVGEENGKTGILETGWAFCGMESSSILEPAVKIARITGKTEHIAFADYIVSQGCCSRENLFRAVLSGKSPRNIGDNGVPSESIAKAYEMMSCFEGLVEYYRLRGREEDRAAALAFRDKLIEEEITELGSGGADGPFNLGPGTGEQWNATRAEQANPDLDKMMETCVTVTWMKLNLQLLRLEGNSAYADSIERSAYNALCGALRPDGRFFEYFPRFNGIRNTEVNFSYNVGGFDLSCCTANGPMGLGIIPSVVFMQSATGPVVNFYTDGSAGFGKLTLDMSSDFPRSGRASIVIGGGSFFTASVLLRIPDYASGFRVELNGAPADITYDPSYPGYAVVNGPFAEGMVIGVSFEIENEMVLSRGSVNSEGNGKALLRRGPVVLSRDSRFTDTGGSVKYSPKPALHDVSQLQGTLLSCEYGGYTWIDYQSAGNGPEKSQFVSWNRIE